MDLTAIRAAIAELASAVVSNSTPYRPDAVHDLPATWVDMPELRKIAHGNATWDVSIDLVIAVSDTWDVDSQNRVDEISVAVWAALDADKTLGTVVNGSVIPVEFLPVKATDNRDWVGGVMTLRIQHTDT